MQEQSMTEIEVLVNQRSKLSSEIEAIDAALEEQRQASLDAFVTQVANHVGKMGFDSTDFVNRLAKELNVGLARVAEATRASRAPRRVYDFGNGRVYKGGKPPTWLTEMMIQAGIDMNDKKAKREYCKANATIRQQ